MMTIIGQYSIFPRSQRSLGVGVPPLWARKMKIKKGERVVYLFDEKRPDELVLRLERKLTRD